MWQKIFRSTKNKKLTLTGLDNQDGQIAIFIALIFQILFIFFAMLINIGLIVHDKINLQNSVDLAAYYGAERQAELLNEIAHINYQIRQDYKLLAWRNQVLGPYAYDSNITQSFLPQPPQDVPADQVPSACLTHSGWDEIYRAEPNPENQISYCQQDRVIKPAVPSYTGVSTIAVSGALSSYLNRVAVAVSAQCHEVGPRDWYYASLWFFDYKQAVYNRSSEIRAIAMNLSKKGTLFQDRKLSLVFDGVKNTFLKNLTDANRSSVIQQKGPPKDFEFINSLSSDVPGGCDSAVNGTPVWLHENRITPLPTYSDAHEPYIPGRCSTEVKFLMQLPSTPLPPAYNDNLLKAVVAGEPAPTVTSGMYSSLGFEKNPWCLAYVGVRAKTKPRKPFAPFGSPITLEARAFASPFGGRIGPWNHEKWSPGSPKSDSGDLTDKLVNPRTEEAPSPPSFEQAVPNYSRFPGDSVGLRSKLVHYLFARAGLMNAFPRNPSPNAIHLKYEDYLHVGSDSDVLPQATVNHNPVVPAKPTGQQFLRMLENAAVAPDLFDITYYSIDADYYTNYSNISTTGTNNAPYSDLGSSKDNNSIERDWNVKEQMKLAKLLLVNQQLQGVHWLVPSLDYLLTGWTQGKAGEYPTNPSQFAECMIHPNYTDKWPAVPGYCVVGGRTGYSVRLISRHYLKAKGGLELGGTGVKGALTNPPPSGW